MTLQCSLHVIFRLIIALISIVSAKHSGGRGSSHSHSSTHSHSSFHSSSTHYYGGYTVGHYRGGGHSSSHRSTRPTISEKQIVEAIFIHSNQTFYTQSENNSFHYDSNWTIPSDIRLSLISSKPSNGMMVSSDLVYYWGLRYLPQSPSNCSSNDTVGDNSCITDVIDTCLRSVSDLSQLKTVDFFTHSNESLTKLSWNCPSNQRCCDWECCEAATMSFVESSMVVIFIIALIVYAIRTISSM